MYLARENGYYADENLEVEFVIGGMDESGEFIDPTARVVSGQADFGINDSMVLLQARTEGHPVVTVASIYQRHPLAMTSLGEKNITRLQDLVGKTVHISYSSEIIYQAMLSIQGIDPAQINQVERTDFTSAPLLTGEADVIDGWITYDVIYLTLQGREVNFIMASDCGLDVYSDVIFTSEDIIANKPELVERFVRATIRGMQDAVDDPEKAAEVTLMYNDEFGPEFELAVAQRAVQLLNLVDSPPGMMDPTVWETTHQILLDQGMLSAPIDIESAYTLDFLKKVYPDQ